MKNLLSNLIELSLEKGAHQADVHASIVSGFTATIRNHKREQQEKHQQQSYNLCVYKDHKSASISSSDFTEAGLRESAAKAVSLLDLSEADTGIELAPLELMAKNIVPPKLHYKTEVGLDEAFEIALAAEKGLLNTKDNVRSDSTSFSEIENQSYLLNSHGLNYFNQSTQYSISAGAIAEDSKSMEIDYDYDVKLDFKDLDKADAIGNSAAKKALRKLESRKIKTTKSPVIFSNEVSGSLMSHLLTALMGGSQYHEQSFYLGALKKKVLPDFIDVIEDPFIEKSAGSRAIDGEGLAKRKQHFIKNGVIENYILNHYTATKLKMEHTANAGGTSNVLVLQSNPPNFKQLVEQMNRGLIVTGLMGSSVNPVTGNYSRGASGFWVEKGLIQYPVKEITIAGNLKDMFQNIQAVGSDVDLRKSMRVGSILISEMTIAGN